MLSRVGRKASRPLAAVAALAVAGAMAGLVSCATGGTEEPVKSQHSAAAPAGITADLTTVAATRVFFGHQSVGMNILDGVRAVYAAQGVPAPPIREDAAPAGASGGFIDQVFIGENENPGLKISDFAARLRAGLGQRVDVAMMKFCYVDVTSGTDVNGLFAQYRTTMAALAREFPKVTFVYATVPLTTEPGLLGKAKQLVSGSGGSAADNAARERLNALIRHEYAAGGHLFDLAAAESTAPDGSRVSGTYQGQRYYALDSGYASDSGHLNATGARAVATAWLQAVARAGRK